MANILYYPHLNPVKFYLPAPDETYHSRHIDDFEFFDSIPEWEEHVDYLQPWQFIDRLRLQLLSDFGPHNVKFLNEQGDVLYTAGFAQVVQSEDNPGLWFYELDLNLNVLPEGIQRWQLESGVGAGKLILKSNRMDVRTKHKHSVHLAYKHYQYHESVMFLTGIEFFLRTEGSNKFKSPASTDESYPDQTENETLLSSTPYRLFELIIGDAAGVPPYMIDMVNRVFSCSEVKIDGRKFTKPKGNKWEANEQDGFPLKGWRVELRESINHSSMVYLNNQPQNARIAIVINSDSKGFGTDTGGTVNQITDVQ